MIFIKIKGRLLLFNEHDKIGVLFSKDCNITIPEKMPLVWDFKPNVPDYIVGTAVVKRDDEGLILTGEITNQKFIDLLNNENIENLGVGGFYNRVQYGKPESGERVVTGCNLVYLSITLSPVNPKYTFKIIESED